MLTHIRSNIGELLHPKHRARAARLSINTKPEADAAAMIMTVWSVAFAVGDCGVDNGGAVDGDVGGEDAGVGDGCNRA
jgi:hypothetical protein